MQVTTRRLVAGAGALAGAGAAGLAYAAGYEVRAYRLQEYRVPVLAAGSPPLRLLHISDLHLLPRHAKAIRWLLRLADLEPDLVISTGDHLAHPDAVPTVLEALGPLLALPGAFVFGSNDYFAPRLKNPARYLTRSHAEPRHGPQLPTDELRAALAGQGWAYLGNARARLGVAAGAAVELVGVDDPHIHRDDLAQAGRPEPGAAAVRIGVSHAPYRRALDALAGDGARLLLAGHTHGGQLCLPGFGALVTNCDLPRRQASGLSRYPADGADRDRPYLHVSAGLGTSPYTPVRFACPPEASLLTLEAP